MHKLIVTSALALGSTIALATTAMAQSVDIEFNGIVPTQCGFENPTNGILAFDFQNSTSRLDSQAAGGAPGQVTLVCNQAATLSVSAPVQTTGPQVFGGSASATVISNAGSAVSNSSVFIPAGASPLPLTVNMAVDNNGNVLTPGNYTYVVTLTVTP